MSDAIRSETELYPTFPYLTDEQFILNAPNYHEVAEKLGQLCLDSNLIASFEWKPLEQYDLVHIQTMDGEYLILSDMQAVMLLKGILKGYKRLREDELGLAPLYDKRELLTRRQIQAQSPTPVDMGGARTRALPKPLRSRTPEEAQAQGILDGFIQKMKQPTPEQHTDTDTSWLDGLFDD